MLVSIVGVALAAVLVLQVSLLLSASNTADRVDEFDAALTSLSKNVTSIENSIVGIEENVAAVGEQVDDLDTAPIVAPSSGGESSAAPATGALPRFVQGAQDAAVGMQLGRVSGPEYYSAAAASIDPADGTMRVWFVWAHWCPFCQEEMPVVSTWYSANRGEYPAVELVSVTTSIDSSRGNPLEPYLEDLALPFPVLVDEDFTLAQQLGVSAFPFWVVTDGEGTVLLRTTGLLQIEQGASIFTQLEEIAAA